VAILCLAALAGCTSGIIPGLAPSPSKAEIARWSAPLPEADQKRLVVWHGEHPDIWDARVHSSKSCPVIYSLKYKNFQAGTMSAEDWAEHVFKCFKAKHKEEGHCDCDEQLGIVAVISPEPPPVATAPDPDLAEAEAAVKAATPAAPAVPGATAVAPVAIPKDVEAKVEAKMEKWIDVFNKIEGLKK